MRGEKVWTIKARKDGCPVANVYHFWAPAAERIMPFSVSIPPKNKAVIASIKGRQSLLWKVSSVYESPTDWMTEAETSGEVVLWIPDRALVEAWLENPAMMVYICYDDEAFAVVRPTNVYIPANQKTPPSVMEFVRKHDPKVQLASVAFVTGRSFGVLINVTDQPIEEEAPKKKKRQRKRKYKRKKKFVKTIPGGGI